MKRLLRCPTEIRFTAEPLSMVAALRTILSLIFVALLATVGLWGGALAAAPASANSGPLLTIPTEYPAGAPGTVVVPISFQRRNTGVAGMAFSIDLDDDCLTIDTSQGKRVADAVIFHLPPQFRGSAAFDPGDAMGELDIAIADYSPPLSTLPDRSPLLSLTLTMVCTPQPGETLTIPLRFAESPSPSFSNTLGRGLPGTGRDGSLAITLAEPTPEPSETPPPAPEETPEPVNTAPTARSDSAQTTEYRAVTVDVLANDSDPDGDLLEIVGVTQGGFGTVTHNLDNTLTYLPDPGHNGTDLFAYTIGDGRGGLAETSVTVVVAGVNIPPVAAADRATTAEDSPVTLDLLANDTDPDGAEDGSDLVLVVLGRPLVGTVTHDGQGVVTYMPAPDAFGEDRFTYAIVDSEGGSAVGEVVIDVRAVNDPPRGAGIGDQVIYGGEAVQLQVEASDPDGATAELRFAADGLPPGLTIDPLTGLIHGTVAGDAAGEYQVVVTVDDGEAAVQFTARWLVTVPTDVAFSGLSATVVGPVIRVEWVAAGDGELIGFRLYRTTVSDAAPSWTAVSPFIPARGQSTTTYRFADPQAMPGVTYRYMLSILTVDGPEGEYVTAPVTRVQARGLRVYLPVVWNR